MSVRVQVTVSSEDRGAAVTFEVAHRPSGDNPLFYASRVRESLLRLAERLDRAVVAQHGDVDPGNDAYVPPLPTLGQWS